MQGIYYAIFVVSVLVVIRWYIQNERSGPDGTKGLLAMRTQRTPKKFVARNDGQRRDQKPGAGNATRPPRKTT
jgi:hypothetical protein